MKPRCVPVLIVSSVFLIGMGGTVKTPSYYKAKFQELDLSDGVNKEEAVIIAQHYLVEQGYFEKGAQNEIAIEKPKVDDSPLIRCWVVAFPTIWRERLESGLRWLTIHIDKKTGQIKSEGWHPS